MSRPYSRRSLRLIAVLVCFSFVVSSLFIRPRGAQANVSAAKRQQGNEPNGKARKVKAAAPRKGPPPFAFPNLDEMKGRGATRPQAQPPVASSVRSKHKPARSGQGFAPVNPKSNASANVRAHHSLAVANS